MVLKLFPIAEVLISVSAHCYLNKWRGAFLILRIPYHSDCQGNNLRLSLSYLFSIMFIFSFMSIQTELRDITAVLP